MPLKRWFDRDLVRGLCLGLLVGGGVLLVALPTGLVPRPAAVPQAGQVMLPRVLDFAGETVSADARRLAQWVVGSGDNGTQPFVLLDKRDARVLVFSAQGRLLGATPVLLGHAEGDDSVPGIGDRPIESVRPEERTTPAGRFVSQPGRNALGEEVLWVDYGAAVSMHRVRLTNPAEQRAERLASATPADNRISYGCINLPVSFFEQVLWPNLRGGRGVVYVLPETRPLEQAFPALAAPATMPTLAAWAR